MTYIIFDLEATCWEDSAENRQSEIIEIGAVKFDDSIKRVGTFQTFVQPSRIPDLSDFCKQLTHITQEQVDHALYFQDAILLFEDWILNGNQDNKIAMMSWGTYDKRQLLVESESKEYQGRIIRLLDCHCNLKADFATIHQIKPCGMAGALRYIGLPLQGTHHRGIDDALNISAIFESMYHK